MDSKYIPDRLAVAKRHMDHHLHSPVDEKDPLFAGSKYQKDKSLSLASILMACHSEQLMVLAMEWALDHNLPYRDSCLNIHLDNIRDIP
mmetsp:Transcript_10232/g.24467  ORF Transcript_10232/g.24467 Transcript_10232/m.24467 type:complete len:89 (-) Transcript_10232:703-969(-)